MKKITLQWQGPFSFLPSQRQPEILHVAGAKKPGVYLWALPINGTYFVNYVGIATESIAARQDDHIRFFLSARYTIYEPEEFGQGRKEVIFDPLNGLSDFLARYDQLLVSLTSYLKLIHLFFAPLEVEKVLLERIESSLIESLRNAGGPVTAFLDNERISRWVPHAQRIAIAVDQNPKFEGIPIELRV